MLFFPLSDIENLILASKLKQQQKTARLLSDRNKILNDEQRRQRNKPQIKIDNAENSLFLKKMKCIMINNYYKGLRIL